ncbi:tRNA pseudouridine(55) synthase TruB [Bacillus mycoides]|jgi:tRNA pseudouridine55 synthase|uniref:tRNA pseudouridine synthase B n=6 Tax=Bacillus cereus group TaxID=86661 RepID=A0A0A0WNI8_BACMY|nr:MULTISPECIES: tRNA pseudouridine(55) synthase TruB [Bacillus]EEL04903.1 tRNA pseudouridine synthase B [Bacillus cereus BDRD-ST196]EJQ68083.1 tRNA pseudouridine synthase B [Bacillus cereus HuA2-4]EJR53378.1 tRNA pseudouridine synthase B [Bacillus cereus VD107]EJS04111.1 tRNA pseudouridine synthase B [Bacillus cereus VDM034]EJS15321.1 tRNA pseudouridine synthase B [Bacillus cereus VDM062]MBK5357186.1 tRNA pseudouridine(55) synthase TruB [Bacillus sp. TH44]RAN89269.1 tRNA pseudouridine(55) s
MEGVVLLHKPKGMTSHDCVFKLRKILREKRIGHTGTLDPDVTGVLPICVGRATKIAQFLTSETKTYEGEVTLGFSTTTEDASGEVVEKQDVNRVITRKEVEEVLAELTGTIEQMPPMFSAVKVNGKKLYEYARAGQEVERPVRTITIHEFVLLDEREVFEGENISFRFRVTCSKGTYVRTLAVMIGEKLGFPSHMSHLVRTASGEFLLEDCISFEEIEENVQNGTVESIFISIDEALSKFPKMVVDEKQAEKIKNGMFLKNELETTAPFITVFDKNDRCLAIYEHHPKHPGMLKPMKVLVNNQELKL